MVQLDLEKAFDRTCHHVLVPVFSHVGFGKVAIQDVKMYYTKLTTRLAINSGLSENMHVLSFVRQCCPLSPLLFALYSEALCLSFARDDYSLFSFALV